jgi:hypothetical protein
LFLREKIQSSDLEKLLGNQEQKELDYKQLLSLIGLLSKGTLSASEKKRICAFILQARESCDVNQIQQFLQS